MSDNSKCPGCGHSFINDSPVQNGYCKWCVNQTNNPSVCYVCGEPATCSSGRGTLCNSRTCHEKDEEKRETAFQKENGYQTVDPNYGG